MQAQLITLVSIPKWKRMVKGEQNRMIQRVLFVFSLSNDVNDVTTDEQSNSLWKCTVLTDYGVANLPNEKCANEIDNEHVLQMLLHCSDTFHCWFRLEY